MLLISSILTPILEPVQTFLTPKKHYLQAFSLSIYPLFFIFHKSLGKGLQYLLNLFPVVTTNRVLIALISFIVKFYLLFRINFLYSKVVCL